MKNIEGNKPLFKFNGVPFTPNGNARLVSSQFVDAGRNARAQVIAQKINRRQVKYDAIVFDYLSADKWSELRRMIEGFEVNVTYYDDYLGRVITRLFYFGDSSANPFEFDSKNHEVAVPLSYTDCQVNITDMGH